MKTFRTAINDCAWKPIETAPKDGTIIYVADEFDEADLASWSYGEWTCELGCCGTITKWAPLSIN